MLRDVIQLRIAECRSGAHAVPLTADWFTEAILTGW